MEISRKIFRGKFSSGQDLTERKTRTKSQIPNMATELDLTKAKIIRTLGIMGPMPYVAIRSLFENERLVENALLDMSGDVVQCTPSKENPGKTMWSLIKPDTLQKRRDLCMNSTNSSSATTELKRTQEAAMESNCPFLNHHLSCPFLQALGKQVPKKTACADSDIHPKLVAALATIYKNRKKTMPKQIVNAIESSVEDATTYCGDALIARWFLRHPDPHLDPIISHALTAIKNLRVGWELNSLDALVAWLIHDPDEDNLPELVEQDDVYNELPAMTDKIPEDEEQEEDKVSIDNEFGPSTVDVEPNALRFSIAGDGHEDEEEEKETKHEVERSSENDGHQVRIKPGFVLHQSEGMTYHPIGPLDPNVDYRP